MKAKVNFVKAASLDELKENEGIPLRINNICIALFKLPSGEVYAVENSCPHIGAPLHNGIIEEKNITCLWHGWSFDLRNGKSSNCPGVAIKYYPTKIEADHVWIGLED